MAMPRIDLKLKTPIVRTPRVMQVEGMFDVAEAAESIVELGMDVDLNEHPWSIGLITGPSGCGKSTIARELFGDCLIEGYEWDRDRAIVDGFGDLGVRDVTKALSSVGFSSPPAWLRPFHVLSNGERFRVNLARALCDPRELIAIDEFTSVVDRTVARIGSAAVAKQVRKTGKRLVAVSCHDDLVEWLQPDWVLEPHVGLVTWRSVQPRPAVEVEIVRCSHAAWPWFAPHHYLSQKLAPAAKCFLGLVEGRPAAFGALINFPHPHMKRTMRYSRQSRCLTFKAHRSAAPSRAG
jgi:ABC-type ATPase involved in cell division